MKNSIVIFLLAVVTGYTQAQEFVLNNNFENSGIADLSEWQITCGADTVRNAPTGGNDWCIKVFGGNTQGCFPGMAFQKIPTIVNGQQLILSGWAYAEVSQFVGIYFGTINNNTISIQTGDTTSANSWKFLMNEFTANIAAGDTAIVVLDGGLVGGPLQGYGYFDLISLEQVTGIVTNKEVASIKLFPNPFNSETTLYSSVPLQNATIHVVNNLGETVKKEVSFSGNSFQLNSENFTGGMYYVKVIQDNKVVAVTKLLNLK
jgi:hypothetical protein